MGDKYKNLFSTKSVYEIEKHLYDNGSKGFSLMMKAAFAAYEHINLNTINHEETGITRFLWIMWYKFIHCLGSDYNPIDDHSITGYYDKLCELLFNDNEEN